ncbi:MAG: FecR family protein [Bacteroidota bacterium]
MMTEQDARNLLGKYHQGTATPEEVALLEAWYASVDPKGLPELLTETRERSAASLRETLVAYSNPVKTLRLLPRIAAAAAILLVLSGTLYLVLRPVLTVQVAQVPIDIKPGTNQATLTLANGKTIALTDQQGVIAQQAGVQIKKSGNTITYESQAATTVAYNTLTTKAAQQFPLTLPDGTKIWLNASSSVRFPTVFNGAERKIELLYGEIYVEVVHNAEMPFRVASKGQLVEDIGTQFNINAYADEPLVRTTLVEGAIKVNGQAVKPGQQSTLANGQLSVSPADTEAAVAWHVGEFIFRDEDFKTVMRKIARWYDVEVVYDANAPVDHIPGGWVSRSKNISAVLKMMAATGKVHFKVEGRRITVSK